MVADLVEPSAALTNRSGLDEVKISRGVALEVEDVLVEVFRGLQFEIEDVIAVRLAVAVRIAELPKTIAAGDEHLAVHDLEAERMIESGGETAPSHLVEFIIDT